jgi:hypothetical protein
MHVNGFCRWSLTLSVSVAMVAILSLAPSQGQEKVKTSIVHGEVVYPDGKPLVNAVVRVGDQLWKPPPGKPNASPEWVTEVKADKDGKFQVKGLKPGVYFLGVSHETNERGYFYVGGVQPFKLVEGKAVDVGTIKTKLEDLLPKFLRDIENGDANR